MNFFFSSRRRHTRLQGDWSSDVCSSDLAMAAAPLFGMGGVPAQVRVVAAGAVAVLICVWTPVAAPANLLSLAGLVSVAEIGRASCRESKELCGRCVSCVIIPYNKSGM